MWFVYILKCDDGSLYTGIAQDVKKRFLAHKKGRGGKYTRSHRVVAIVYREEVTSKNEALKREFEIKNLSRREKLNFISSKPV